MISPLTFSSLSNNLTNLKKSVNFSFNPINSNKLFDLPVLQNSNFILTSRNLFKSPSLNKLNNYGGCSLTVECGTVDPETGVQLSPSALRDFSI